MLVIFRAFVRVPQPRFPFKMDKPKPLKQPIVPPRPSIAVGEDDSKTLKSRDSHQEFPDSKIIAAQLPNLRIRSKPVKKGMFNNLMNGSPN